MRWIVVDVVCVVYVGWCGMLCNVFVWMCLWFGVVLFVVGVG